MHSLEIQYTYSLEICKNLIFRRLPTAGLQINMYKCAKNYAFILPTHELEGKHNLSRFYKKPIIL